MSDGVDALKTMPRFRGILPTLVASFVLALLLLFHGDLHDEHRLRLVASLVVCAPGTGLIAYVHLLLYVRSSVGPKRTSDREFTRIVGCQVVWFLVCRLMNTPS